VDEHKTVLLSILATLLAAAGTLVATVVVAGGLSAYLIEAYVLPLIVTAFSLGVFAVMLFAHKKGKMPGFPPDEAKPGDSHEPRQADQKDKGATS
jgi:hypothetical protein